MDHQHSRHGPSVVWLDTTVPPTTTALHLFRHYARGQSPCTRAGAGARVLLGFEYTNRLGMLDSVSEFRLGFRSSTQTIQEQYVQFWMFVRSYRSGPTGFECLRTGVQRHR